MENTESTMNLNFNQETMAGMMSLLSGEQFSDEDRAMLVKIRKAWKSNLTILDNAIKNPETDVGDMAADFLGNLMKMLTHFAIMLS